jgi:SAM-dependent methyltransferase
MTIAAGTTAFYDDWAANGREAERSALSHRFNSVFAPGARILDVGCGMGRDLAVLLSMGFDAHGVEPNAAMRERAIVIHPALAGRIADASLPDIGLPFGGGFDGIVCSAVLMHVPTDALAASLASLDALLRPQARLLMALPEMRRHLLVDGRDPDGRTFVNHAPDGVQGLLAELDFALIQREDIAAPSEETEWRVLLFERRPGAPA